MSREVRNIFIMLIGTIVLIVVSSLFIEMVNVSLSGVRIQSDARLACKKAMSLFTQESYKARDSASGDLGGSINPKPIKAADGTEYVSGKFYAGETVEEIYADIYDVSHGNTDFADWANKLAGNWQSIDLLNRYINNIGSFHVKEMPDYEDYLKKYSYDIDKADEEFNDDLNQYTEYLTAKSYVDTYVTPLNFGVPYMDYETLDKIFKWNLSAMLANYDATSPDGGKSIVYDEDGNLCIERNGFRIYANQARIIESSIKYEVFNLDDTIQRHKFENLTHLSSDNLGFTSDTGDFIYLGNSSDERRHICVLTLEYSIPMTYVGITPLKSIFESVWTNEVEGYHSDVDVDLPDQYFEYSKSSMMGGGFHGDADGIMPVPGQIVFYLVR